MLILDEKESNLLEKLNDLKSDTKIIQCHYDGVDYFDDWFYKTKDDVSRIEDYLDRFRELCLSHTEPGNQYDFEDEFNFESFADYLREKGITITRMDQPIKLYFE